MRCALSVNHLYRKPTREGLQHQGYTIRTPHRTISAIDMTSPLALKIAIGLKMPTSDERLLYAFDVISIFRPHSAWFVGNLEGTV